MRIFIVGAGVCALAACGGGSGPEPVLVGATRQAVGDLPVTVRYDAATDTYFVTRAGIPEVGLAPLPGYDFGTFRGANVDLVGGNSFGILISETPESQATVYVRDSALVSVTATRLADTTIPASGSATLTGDYVGVAQEAVGVNIQAIVTGDAAVTLDFADRQIDGVVRDRIYRSAMDPSVIFTAVTATDLTLETAEISTTDGSFSGVTAGGDLSFNVGTPSAFTSVATGGTFSGVIAGPDGDQVVIGVEANFDNGSEQILEYGAIAAGH